ncbi:MAG: hypothetical protein PHY77_04195 [Desulfotomaculaceae bacterium]|nr:hypothetical protein [Desulfotomaculaceae bacterium]
MWERLHVQVTMEQMKWLRAEAFTRGKSIGEIIRNLIGAAMSRQTDQKGKIPALPASLEPVGE